MNPKHLRVLSACLFPFFGCGQPSTSSDPALSSVAAFAVTSAAELPSCDDSRRGILVFVEQDKHFVVCKTVGWETIDLRGANGANGANGSTGATGGQGSRGPTGLSGADWTADGLFSASIHCGGQLETTGIWFSYDAALLRSGDVFASGSIRGDSFEVGMSKFYSREQNGATTAEVLLELDLQGAANYGYWSLSLNRTTLVTSIVYYDVDASGGMTTWTMPASKCVANTY